MAFLANLLIDTMPKAELHVHIEGTLEPEMMLALARRNGVELPWRTPAEVAAAYRFDCLQDFLDIYYHGMSVLLTEQDFRDLTMAYLERVHRDNAVHVEIFFDPQAHMVRGVAFDTVLAGILKALREGEREFGITSKLIMCFLRHLSEEEGFAALAEAKRHRDHIFGVGLDSSERGHPPGKFTRLFAEARGAGFAAVAHAGEEGPPAYVAEALDSLQVSRIDHGNAALDDPALTARLAAEQVPLTMCPLSNLRLKVISEPAASPVARALEAGLLVTVNSDDPSYFGGYLNDNYRAVHGALGLSEHQLVTLAANSFAGAFLDGAAKQARLERLGACVHRLRHGPAGG